MLDFSDPVFSAAKEKKRKDRRRRRVYAAPERSARLYVYIAPSKVHMFRYFLEARDNLGIMTVVDRWRAALLLRYSPHQEKEIREFLEAVNDLVPITLAAVP